MNEFQSVVPLTEKDRKLLEQHYSVGWAIPKWMLIGVAVLLGGGWLWIAWESLHDKIVIQVFIIVTVVVIFLAVGFLVSTLVFYQKTVSPLEKDLEEGKKTLAVGKIIALELAGENTEMIFQAHGHLNAEAFNISLTAQNQSGDVFIPGREVEVEYTPHARYLLIVRLLVPLAPVEIKERREKERIDTIGIFILVGLLTVGIGWMFDLLLVFTLLYFITAMMLLCIIWWAKRKSAPEK